MVWQTLVSRVGQHIKFRCFTKGKNILCNESNEHGVKFSRKDKVIWAFCQCNTDILVCDVNVYTRMSALRKVIIHIEIPNRAAVGIRIVTDDEGGIGIVEDVESYVGLYFAEPEIPAVDAGLEGVFVEGKGKFEGVAGAVAVERNLVFACRGDDFAVFAGA